MKFKTEELELLENVFFEKGLLEIICEYKNSNIREISQTAEAEFFEELHIKGIEFDVTKGKSNLAIQNIQDKLQNEGYQVYFSVFSDSHNELNTISILKTSDEMDIVRFNGTNGANHGVLPNDIIDKLKKWNDFYGLDIAGANNDWIMFSLHTLPENLDVFVEELIEFCPDYLYQDNYSEHGIDWSKFMIRSMIFYHKIIKLWWD